MCDRLYGFYNGLYGQQHIIGNAPQLQSFWSSYDDGIIGRTDISLESDVQQLQGAVLYDGKYFLIYKVANYYSLGSKKLFTPQLVGQTVTVYYLPNYVQN